MHSILVVDDQSIVREPIAEALRVSGFAATSAASGEEALERMRLQTPHLVLLDVSMPGIDGITVLHRMRENPATADIPVILLTGSNDRAIIFEAVKLGVRDYMLKSEYTSESLLARVRKYTDKLPAPEPRPPEVKPAEITLPVKKSVTPFTRAQIAKEILTADIKMISGVVGQLMATASSPRSTLAEVAACLKRDPALSRRILTVANSVAYATNRQKIVLVEDAVRRVGLSAVRNLAASIGVFDVIELTPENPELTRRWQHSLAVAAIMEKLASLGDACLPGIAYMVGLCHELPDIILQSHFPEAYNEAVAEAQTTGRCKRVALAERFGISFHEVAALVLARIRLPEPIHAPLNEFLVPGIENQSVTAAGGLSRLLNIASLYANAVLMSPGLNEMVRNLKPNECEAVIGADAVQVDLDGIASETSIMCAMIGRTRADQMTKPLAEKRALRVLYHCEQAHTAPDPLKLLLDHLVDEVVAGDVRVLACRDDRRFDAVVVSSDNARSAADFAAASVSQPGLPIVYLTSQWPKTLAVPADIKVLPPAVTANTLLRTLDRAQSVQHAEAT